MYRKFSLKLFQIINNKKEKQLKVGSFIENNMFIIIERGMNQFQERFFGGWICIDGFSKSRHLHWVRS